MADHQRPEVEYGVRFLIPHKNAGIGVWAPDLAFAAHMVLDTPGMAQLVQRKVGPWTPFADPRVSAPLGRSTTEGEASDG